MGGMASIVRRLNHGHNMNKINRIVVVDDSETDNIFHEMVLTTADFEGDLKVFESPREALAYMQSPPREAVELMLVDVNMPGMDGWEYVQAITPLMPHFPNLKIVMLTSSSAPEDFSRAKSLPAISGYLTKPLSTQSAKDLLEGRFEAAWIRNEDGAYQHIPVRRPI